MPSLLEMGRWLMVIGVIFLLLGLLLFLLGKTGLGLPRLPGDIFIKKEGYSFYFPIVSCIVISVLLSVLMNLFRR